MLQSCGSFLLLFRRLIQLAHCASCVCSRFSSVTCQLAPEIKGHVTDLRWVSSGATSLRLLVNHQTHSAFIMPFETLPDARASVVLILQRPHLRRSV